MKKYGSWIAAILAVVLLIGFVATLGGIDLGDTSKDPEKTTGDAETTGTPSTEEPGSTGTEPPKEEPPEGFYFAEDSWQFDSELSLASAEEPIEEAVEFYWYWTDETERILCDSVTVTADKVMFGSETVYEISDYNNGWLHTGGVIIEFSAADSPVLVTDRFYIWLANNASQITTEVYSLSGVWKMDLDPELPEYSVAARINYEIFYSLNSEMDAGTGISADSDSLYIDADKYYGLSYHTVSTPDHNLGWDNYYYEIPPVIYFGDEPQEVNKLFYDWFVANATPVADDEPVVMLYGAYEANAELTYVPVELTAGPESDLVMDSISFNAPSADDGTVVSSNDMIDFGEEGRMVTFAFLKWLLANYTPVE